jgi:prolyl 4-hydroxylase
MTHIKAKEVASNVYVIDDFLTMKECEDFIHSSETDGYEESTIITEKGERRIEGVRNNYRGLHTNVELANQLWERVKDCVPARIGNSEAIGLNELFRFYRYEPGQQFKKHIDESFIRNQNEASYFTFMIYLNDKYEGGETKFDAVGIKGKKGMALVFLHSLPHEGAEVTAGIKYVLRTDIMYKLIEE